MRRMSGTVRYSLLVAVMAAGVLIASYPLSARAEDVKVLHRGGQEVPPVSSSGAGTGAITVGEDKSVSGSVKTTGVNGTMAHIHNGAAGKNGPVIVPLTKDGDGTWTVPSGAKLTDAQYAAFKAGDLYVNVHSAQHQSGEIRGQLKP